MIDAARRQTTTRRQLAASPDFADLSPEVGQLDESAFQALLDRDADEALGLLAAMASATDEGLRALARSLAARLFLDLAKRTAPDDRGIGRIVSAPYRPDGGDVDVDRSLEGVLAATAERRALRPEEIVVRSWARPSTAWCLVVDRSGSMHGRPLATAALAAAAMGVRATGPYAVLSFGRDVVAPKAIWEQRATDDVIDRVLALRGHGTTDVAAALLAAHTQLRAVPASRRVTVLLSDCRATEPGDVVAAARTLDELVILAPAADPDAAADLAGAVGARWSTFDGPASIAAAVATALDR